MATSGSHSGKRHPHLTQPHPGGVGQVPSKRALSSTFQSWIMSSDRILIHGPWLRDFTDFLCFDKIVYPVTKTYLRPSNSPPGIVGYPHAEPIPEPVLQRLTEAGLVISPKELVPLIPEGEDFVAQLLKGPDAMTTSMQETGANLFKISFSCFQMPASKADELKWLIELDSYTALLADMARRRGRSVIPKYYLENVIHTLKPGWSMVLSLAF